MQINQVKLRSPFFIVLLWWTLGVLTVVSLLSLVECRWTLSVLQNTCPWPWWVGEPWEPERTNTPSPRLLCKQSWGSMATSIWTDGYERQWHNPQTHEPSWAGRKLQSQNQWIMKTRAAFLGISRLQRDQTKAAHDRCWWRVPTTSSLLGALVRWLWVQLSGLCLFLLLSELVFANTWQVLCANYYPPGHFWWVSSPLLLFSAESLDKYRRHDMIWKHTL